MIQYDVSYVLMFSLLSRPSLRFLNRMVVAREGSQEANRACPRDDLLLFISTRKEEVTGPLFYWYHIHVMSSSFFVFVYNFAVVQIKVVEYCSLSNHISTGAQ